MVSKLNHNHPYLLWMGMRNDESLTRKAYEDVWVNKAEWGNDMTMQIQNFMEDVKNGKVQSEKHCLEDTKKILEVSEMISA